MIRLAKAHFGLLTFGVFLITVAIWTAFWIFGVITFNNLVPLILLSNGAWIVIVATLKVARVNEHYGAFETFGWGTLLIVLGGSWYLINEGLPIALPFVFIFLLFGALAIVASLRKHRI
jgi:hypothetical protein